jgi:hypothetical protein
MNPWQEVQKNKIIIDAYNVDSYLLKVKIENKETCRYVYVSDVHNLLPFSAPKGFTAKGISC